MRLLGEKIATAIDNGDTVVIKFEKSNRYYDVDSDGNIEGPLKIVFDTNPGQLDGKGTEEEPFIIMSIEDLVYFSQQVNEGENTYLGEYVTLGKTLDFNLDLSYINTNTTDYDVYLGGDGTTGLKEQLTKGKGFRPIGETSAATSRFAGNFNGNNNEIKNIKIETESFGGLFGYIYGGSEEKPKTIKNLTITGSIIADNFAGGIVGEASYSYISLENLTNYATITTSSIAGGGIVGRSFNTGGTIKLDKCFNYGSIISGGATGGIIGHGYGAKIQVKNSANYAKLESTGGNADCGAGGIVGGGSVPIINVYNSCNYGDLSGTLRVGGICGRSTNNTSILTNVFNVGKTEKSTWTPGGLAGQDSYFTRVTNAYYISTYQHGIGWGSVVAGTQYTDEQMKEQAFVNELNKNIEDGCPYEVENDDETTTTVAIDTTGWAKWVYNENSYPTLDTTTIWNGTDWEKN